MLRFSIPTEAPKPGAARLPGVTALRGLALVFVLIYHGGGVLDRPNRLHGEIGVDIFLPLSGFLLALNSSDSSARDFLRKRFFRIFPTYWMAVALFAVLGTALLHRTYTVPDLLTHLVGLQAIRHGAYFSDLNDSFWFITAILFLYLVFLALRRWSRDVLLVLGVGGLAALVCLLPYPGFNHLSGRLLGFFLGVALGQLWRGGEIVLRPGVIFAAGAVTFTVLEWRELTSVYYPLAAVAVVAVFALLDRWLRPWPVGRRLLAPLEFLGAYSYEIYLFHQPLIRDYNLWFQRTVLQREPSHRELALGLGVALLLAVGLALAAAAVACRRRVQAWVLAAAGAALLALALGAGPALAGTADGWVAAAKIPFRPQPVVEAGTTWNTAAPASRTLAGWSGPLRLTLVLPASLGAPAQPLVVTGRTGQGDLLGIVRVDARHVHLTLDHWGDYALVSPDLTIGAGAEHTVEIAMGSLLPPAGAPEPYTGLRRRLYVALDGQEAFNRDMDFHPAAVSEAWIGVNLLGGSTTGPRFTGRLLRVESLAPGLVPVRVTPIPAPAK